MFYINWQNKVLLKNSLSIFHHVKIDNYIGNTSWHKNKIRRVKGVLVAKKNLPGFLGQIQWLTSLIFCDI